MDPEDVGPGDGDGIDAKVLDTKDRNRLDDESYAVPGKRKLPIHDADHVRNALARFNQTKGLTPAEKATARARINRAAKKFGVKVSAELEDNSIHAMQIQAMSLDLPHVDNHPNRMPFSGILTRIDKPSDQPPNGSGGKRILLTRAAADAALGSLLGMAVDLKKDMDGHDAQNKVGIITAANIVDDAINIEGFIYAADFPREALRIQMDKANLGFSFEAQNIGVESMSADPLIINRCVFTGAAILLKNEAAYQSTALAASKAKEHEMNEEVAAAVTEAVKSLLAPFQEQLSGVAASVAAQSAAIEEIKKAPAVVHAVSAAVPKVEPHAAHLETAADRMEAAGIGLHETAGHVVHLRRMASAMRAEAHMGKMPHTYHDSGSYFAAGDRQAPVTINAPAPQSIKIEETPEFKAIKAAADQMAAELKVSRDESAAMGTKLADLTARMNGLLPVPERKTLSPEIKNILAKVGLEAPDEEGVQIQVHKLDAAMASVGNLSISDRMRIKNNLMQANILGR